MDVRSVIELVLEHLTVVVEGLLTTCDGLGIFFGGRHDGGVDVSVGEDGI